MVRLARLPLLCLLALAASMALAEPSEPSPEQSVRAGVNDKYLAPDLDVDEWTKRFEGEAREIFVRRREIVEQLGLIPEMAVADVGAGTGLFVGPLAAAVGPGGKVYAVDISPRFVAHLRQRISDEGLTPVEVVLGKERSMELPDDSIDLAFVCDVYHHFEYPSSMLESLRRVLRPGGALVVIDFERIPGRTREWVLDHVRAGKQVFTDEIEDAGFVLEKELQVDGLVENYMLRFRNP
jgi:SAM-dependent methyltransferase